MNEEQDIITLYDENGDEELFEVLFTFHNDDYNKDYIIVFPAGADPDEGSVDMYPFIFNAPKEEDGTEGTFDEIEDDAEFAMVETALNQYLDDLEAKD